MENVVCSSVSVNLPFAQTALIADVHCNESLVRFEVSGFCYTIIAGATLGLSDNPVVLCSGDNASLNVQFIDAVNVGVGQFKALGLVLGGTKVVQSTGSPIHSTTLTCSST